MTPFNFYIDEAGQTGDDLLKNEQPIFTIGGLGIDRMHEAALDELLTKLRKKRLIDFEIKTSTILGKPNGVIIQPIMDFIFETASIPFFIVVEKRFMAAGKIVDNFLDPTHNKATDDSWDTFAGLEIKDKTANQIYDELTDSTMRFVAEAMRKGTVTDMTKALDLMVAEVKDKELQNLLEGVRPSLHDLTNSLQTFRREGFDGAKGSVLNSPGYTTYYRIIMMLEERVRGMNKEGAIIFDSSNEYNEPFAQVLELLQKSKDATIRLGDGRLFHISLRQIKSFAAANSRDHSGLQVGDLIVGHVNHILRKVALPLSSWQPNPIEREWIGYTFIFIMEGFGEFVASNKLIRQLHTWAKHVVPGRPVN